MRSVSWLVGIALGVIAGGATLVVGVRALLVLVPGLVWAARERSRPLAGSPHQSRNQDEKRADPDDERRTARDDAERDPHQPRHASHLSPPVSDTVSYT